MPLTTPSAIGILGGSFNPPHMGHVLAAHYALLRWPLKKVMVVPSFSHPFGKPLPPFEHRFAMCQLAFAHLGDNVEISNVEEQLGGVSFTVETIRELVRKYPGEHFRLIVGGDIMSDLPKWREVDELTKLAPLLVIPRLQEGNVLGAGDDGAALPDVSSTSIREQLAQGKIPPGTVPDKVAAYIRQHDVYASLQDQQP